MPARVKILIGVMLALAASCAAWSSTHPSQSWVRFAVYLFLALITSGLKVPMPRGDATTSVNFPFILLSIIQLSPAQAITIAALSVLAQCRIKVVRSFTLVQIAFNVANTVTATMAAWFVYTSLTGIRLDRAPALALAALVYFGSNTMPVAMAIAWSKRESALRVWRHEFPWYLPFYLVGSILASVAHYVSLHIGWATSLLLFPLIYTIYRAYEAQRSTIQARQKHLEETEALHLRTIEGLAMAIEAKDHGTHDHLVRVRNYVHEIGMALHLDELELKALLTASFLHDIGKLAIPEHIINKPGKLTREEFDQMKTHTVIGAEILERVRFPYPVVPIVRSHHEAWDGTGYPDGLKGEEIPIGARILTVVDCFDALASDRPYRRALPLDQAMAILKEKAGTQFDPNIVELLERHHVELERKASSTSGSIAPLNTSFAVQRGDAPAAGFEQDNATKPASTPAKECQPDHLAQAALALQSLQHLQDDLGPRIPLPDLLTLLSARLRAFIPFDSLALYERTGDTLIPRFRDSLGLVALSEAPIQMGEGLSGWVAQNYRSILNGNPTVEPNLTAAARLRSALAIPILAAPGDAAAVLTFYSAAEHAFSRDHLILLEGLDRPLTHLLRQALAPIPQPASRPAVHLIPQLAPDLAPDLVASA